MTPQITTEDPLVRAAQEARISEWLAEHGEIPAVWCPSAQSRGAARKYPYWGAVHYRIVAASEHEYPTAIARGRTSSDRRSYQLRQRDAKALAKEIEGIVIDSIGRLSPEDMRTAILWIEDRERKGGQG